MRVPFAYENNADLMRRVLVPDPLPEARFEEACRHWRKSSGETLAEAIYRAGGLRREALENAFVEACGGLDMVETPPVAEIKGTEAHILRANGFVVVRQEEGCNWVAGGKELNPDLEPYIGKAATHWRWVLLSPVREGSDIEKALPADWPTGDNPGTTGVRLRNLLEEACMHEAHDVHFERQGRDLRIRMKCGEGMREMGQLHGHEMEQTLRLLKRWAGLSVAENSLPQDGRLRLGKEPGNRVFRASHLHTLDGESLVLRPVGSSDEVRGPEELDIPRELVALMRDTARYEKGIMLFCGATGSGKTTTGYALLKELVRLRLKILTIEDPVEYELEGATQSSVRANSGWDFASALKAYMRQDPDVILVGEIRDRESARLAFQSAMTGHLVISTLHASSIGHALTRLHGWEIPPGTTSESIRLLVHQRMVHEEGAVPRVIFKWEQPDTEALFARMQGHASTGPEPVRESLRLQ